MGEWDKQEEQKESADSDLRAVDGSPVTKEMIRDCVLEVCRSHATRDIRFRLLPGSRELKKNSQTLMLIDMAKEGWWKHKCTIAFLSDGFYWSAMTTTIKPLDSRRTSDDSHCQGFIPYTILSSYFLTSTIENLPLQKNLWAVFGTGNAPSA